MGGGGGKGGGKGGGASDANPMIEYGDKALDLQKTIYNDSIRRSQPWYDTGTSAVNQLSNLLGISNAKSAESFRSELAPKYTRTVYYNKRGEPLAPTTEARHRKSSKEVINQTALDAAVQQALATQEAAPTGADFGKLARGFTADDFQQDPGYQFRLSEGQKALDRQLNARGKTYSPEAAKALMGYNQDMGSQEYNNAFNRFNIENDSLFNRLATLSGFGQTATGQIQNAGQNYSQGASDIYTGMGNAITSANLAGRANNQSMFNSLLSAGAQLGGAYLSGGGSLFSDRRLKVNISEHDERNGYKRYKFAYRNNPEKYFIGVMADEVLKQDPLAVEMDEESGYYMVDYGKIGFEMEEA